MLKYDLLDLIGPRYTGMTTKHVIATPPCEFQLRYVSLRCHSKIADELEVRLMRRRNGVQIRNSKGYYSYLGRRVRR